MSLERSSLPGSSTNLLQDYHHPRSLSLFNQTTAISKTLSLQTLSSRRSRRRLRLFNLQSQSTCRHPENATGNEYLLHQASRMITHHHLSPHCTGPSFSHQVNHNRMTSCHLLPPSSPLTPEMCPRTTTSRVPSFPPVNISPTPARLQTVPTQAQRRPPLAGHQDRHQQLHHAGPVDKEDHQFNSSTQKGSPNNLYNLARQNINNGDPLLQ